MADDAGAQCDSVVTLARPVLSGAGRKEYGTKLLTTGEGGLHFTDNAGVDARLRDMRVYDKRTAASISLVRRSGVVDNTPPSKTWR